MTDARREELRANLLAVEERIARACADAGRPRDDVTLIVVTKTYPASDVDLLVELGITDVGENRHPEAGRKLADLHGPAPRMHFIGGLQTNKANAVARYADIVQSVDRPRLVEALSKGAVSAGRQLGCLVQVDFGETGLGRAGVTPAGVPELADAVAAAEGLRLDGVMTVAPLGADPRPSFDALVRISDDLRRSHPVPTIVSAGMSDDFELAVQSGATHLRVGRSILGERVSLR
ncbi:MAG TPA: YggS family pyridoxal phosphate-dependent enzyme [Aeromicrobium sp.]|nr:YggS family pyridoxal phosphate-dependent enzyme [Aeromicrobium sp.]